MDSVSWITCVKVFKINFPSFKKPIFQTKMKINGLKYVWLMEILLIVDKEVTTDSIENWKCFPCRAMVSQCGKT